MGIFKDSPVFREWIGRSFGSIYENTIEKLGLVISTITTIEGDETYGLPTQETAIFFEGEIVEHLSYYSKDLADRGHKEVLLKINRIEKIPFKDLPKYLSDKDAMIRVICRKRLSCEYN